MCIFDTVVFIITFNLKLKWNLSCIFPGYPQQPSPGPRLHQQVGVTRHQEQHREPPARGRHRREHQARTRQRGLLQGRVGLQVPRRENQERNLLCLGNQTNLSAFYEAEGNFPLQ